MRAVDTEWDEHLFLSSPQYFPRRTLGGNPTGKHERLIDLRPRLSCLKPSDY
jgi:hypothetical protein